MEPELSFCTTNYNCAHVLERHLESIYSNFDEKSFEYIVVDNKSKDGSYQILQDFALKHRNMQVLSKKCTMGRGRQLAFLRSKGEFIVVVDTDTVYYPEARGFVDRYLEQYSALAVQAVFLGIFPRSIWTAVGGRGNFNTGEDFEMWMRIWKTGKMKWYPVKMGTNVKEPDAKDSYDFLSSRYGRFEKFTRLLRREFDTIRLRKYERLDLVDVWKSNTVDLGLGKLEEGLFGTRGSPPLWKLPKQFAKSVWQILTG
jgi:glycosyltransferase involved in cell wall biosynthesis